MNNGQSRHGVPWATLVELLTARAEQPTGGQGYTFLSNADTDNQHLSYAALHQRAKTLAALLQARAPAASRALILVPPGLDYIVAFFGCLYAGVIAVPAYPPRLNRPMPRLRAIVADAGAQLALTSHSLLEQLTPQLALAPDLAALDWIAVDQAEQAGAPAWQPPVLSGDSLAFLQYTAGSTALPKGVMVSHANLLHNLGQIARCFGHDTSSQGVIWLPPYHDMGLIGGILQPLFVGFPVTLMAPAAFLQSPYRWLQAIADTRATTSGGPNFAYDLCIRMVTDEQRATLDLSSWRVAFNGAEPVRAATMAQFSAVFGPCGFRPHAFYPCYGLAEATLIVSGGTPGAPLRSTTVQKTALEQHRIAPAEAGDPAGITLVGAGQAVVDQQIVIVHPESGRPCAPDQVGEIWVAGPSVAQGYWNRSAETAAAFDARLIDQECGPFLRTGDLGFLRGEELYITGRLKDLIIIRGQNHYPQDIELTVEQSHPALRPGAGAAFAIEVEGQEQLVVVQEVLRQYRTLDTEEVAAALRRAVAEQHGVAVYAVALIKMNSIPKTSSGKIQRHAARADYLAGALTLIGCSTLAAEPTPSDVAATEPNVQSRAALLALPDAARLPALEQTLAVLAADLLRRDRTQIDLHRSLLSLGLDSLTAVELKAALDALLAIDVPLAAVLEGESLAGLATQVLPLLAAPAEQRPLEHVPAGGDAPVELPLSHGQRALWFLHQIAPTSAAYTIACALRISGALEIPVLERCFQQLVERHTALRTSLPAPHGEPVQQIAPGLLVHLLLEEAQSWGAGEVAAQLEQAVAEPFDLAHGPLLRITAYREAEDRHVLLLTIHHSVADFWSLVVMLHELHALYLAAARGEQPALPPPPAQYADYVRSQEHLLASARGEQLWQYWQRRLGGPLPILNLPADRARPALQTYSGATQRRVLGAELTLALRALAGAQDVTLYTLLLATFHILLARQTGQDDILVGSPTAGRLHAAFAQMVGYCVNPVVLRASLAGNPTFSTFLRQVRQTVLEALEHQEFPFALLAERLQPIRDPSRSPVFQAMFIFQSPPSFAQAGLAAVALGEPGAQVAFGPLVAEVVPFEHRTAQFDLTLTMAETEHGLGTSLEYNSDLFDNATAARMLDHLETLLAGIAAGPEQQVGALPLLAAEERAQILGAWNSTGTAYAPACMHELIEAQVWRTPDALALVCEGQQLSYRALDARANQLAHHLRTLGVGPDVRVAICAERSPEMLIGLLGILKAGGAYVPLDPTYPRERLALMLEDARPAVLLTLQEPASREPRTKNQEPLVEGSGSRFSVLGSGCCMVDLVADWPAIAQQPDCCPTSGVTPDHLAYVIYTSGSTGRPKGVMLAHRSVANFFVGMDQRVGCDSNDTLLAVTSISFDISVLELFWTLAHGARVVLHRDAAGLRAPATAAPPAPARPLSFSLFYFASDDAGPQGDKYRLLLEGARFADRHGFEAVWTPERHFHAFGGLYPNPSVTSAALATVTERIQLRAGSVVLPLHHPLRVVEEWSVVDNLSRGRVGLAFASGWHADDFVFFPERYASRKDGLGDAIGTVQRLWRGEPVSVPNGAGNPVTVRVYPQPVQRELPIWITAAGTPETFIKAGELGANVLTHLLGQSVEEVAEKIALYRAARARAGHDPQTGHVTLMLHTFLGEDHAAVRERVRLPFTNYLRSSIGLIQNLIKTLNLPLDLSQMSPQDMDDLLAFAFNRYFETSALFGTLETCRPMIERLQGMGVDEVACLIDFGVEADAVLASLPLLDTLRQQAGAPRQAEDFSLATQAQREQVTLLQCTPSMMQMLALDPQTLQSLGGLRAMLLGGEALPPSLAQVITETLPCRLINMYGPTETTIWSATHEIAGVDVVIGRPIAHTQIYLLDQHLQPVPIGTPGELYIGGEGLARGYLERPDLTAERFVPNPFLKVEDRGLKIEDSHLAANQERSSILYPLSSTRLYRTGDLARWHADGRIEYLGRADYQVKIRGHRIELGEIEAALCRLPAVREAVAVAHRDDRGDQRLVAYLVAHAGADDDLVARVRDELRAQLPDFMIPSVFMALDTLPLTENGKVDRKALPQPEARRNETEPYAAPRSKTEALIAQIWQQVLQVEQVGIHDNFFDLGGHSLLMAQVHSQLQEQLRQEIPLVKLLEHPTISALAHHISDDSHDAPSFQLSQERARKQLAGLRRQRGRVKAGENP